MTNHRHRRPHQDRDDDPDVAVDLLDPSSAVEAQPRGYAIDVRIFLAIITATMALAFGKMNYNE
ncbi:hypothetical protein ACHAWF_010837 [Thalassiosira exigua]